MGPTHTIGGVNYADIWHDQLQLMGWLLILVGLALFLHAAGVFSNKDTSVEIAPVVE
jgi:hypothetical protein